MQYAVGVLILVDDRHDLARCNNRRDRRRQRRNVYLPKICFSIIKFELSVVDFNALSVFFDLEYLSLCYEFLFIDGKIDGDGSISLTIQRYL